MRVVRNERRKFWELVEADGTVLAEFTDEELAEWKLAFAEVLIPWTPPTKPSEQLREFIRIGKATEGLSITERDWYAAFPLSEARSYAILEDIADWLEGLGQ